MPAQYQGYIAGGNISPCTVVYQNGTTPYSVVQATAATQKPLGIAQEGTRQAPGVTGSDAYAAHSGESITVYGDGEICLGNAAAGTINPGDYLASDGSGNLVALTIGQTTVNYMVAVALEGSAAVNTRIKVKVQIQATEV